jgi:hypothetical protein
MKVINLTLTDANAFVTEHHRHNKATRGIIEGDRMSNATELLRRALAELIDQDETIRAEFCGMQPWRSPPIIKEIYDYLGENNIPLYTRPEPKRKPMTKDDAWKAYIKAIEDDSRISGCWLFILGVRFAEKHHGISPRCENS